MPRVDVRTAPDKRLGRAKMACVKISWYVPSSAEKE